MMNQNTDALHCLEYERAICGSLMTDPGCLPDIEDTGLTPTDFYSPTLSHLYRFLVDRIQHGEPVEMHIVLETVARRSDVRRFPSWQEMSALGDYPTAAFADHNARSIVGLALRRRMIRQLSALVDGARDSSRSLQDLLSGAERTLSKLAGGVGGREEWTTGEALATLMWQDIQARIKARQEGGVIGLPWGLDELDHAPPEPTGERMAFPPMEKGRLYLIAARPAMGKSSLALQVMQSTLAAGKSVGMFNLEMEKDGVGRKLLALATGLPTGVMRDGTLSEHDQRRANAGCTAMSQWPLYLDTTPGLPIEQIASKARRLAQQLRNTNAPLSLLMVDYAQLIRSQGDNTTDRLAAVSQGLLALGKELGVPVLALAQLNRECEKRADKRPMVSDLRGSGQWEQDAHAILFLYREAYYNPLCGHDNTEVIVAKWRDHRTCTLRIQWNAPTQRFGNPAPRAVRR